MTVNVEDKPAIMLVEDEYIIATDIKERLENMGYSVFPPIESGENALDQLKGVLPDLILMDIVLHKGKIDGIDTALMIHARSPVPIIFLTAYASDDIVNRAMKARPLGYVLKPFNDRELKAVIKIALGRAEMEKRLQKRLGSVETTSGVIPICEGCKKIRDERGTWNQVERFFEDRLDLKFSHGLCPDCATKYSSLS